MQKTKKEFEGPELLGTGISKVFNDIIENRTLNLKTSSFTVKTIEGDRVLPPGLWVLKDLEENKYVVLSENIAKIFVSFTNSKKSK